MIIPKICKELGIVLNAELFGWGAGGADKISKVLRMLNNLGYKKITAIFDGDKVNDYNDCKEKYPKYNIMILPKDDIRDKAEITKNSKDGITTRKGEIKEENKDSFKKLLNNIIKYHDS